MAITYPRALPQTIRWVRSTFSLPRGNAVNQLNTGVIQAMEVSEPLWRVAFESEPLAWAERRAWGAWERTLRGGAGAFLAHDWMGSYPIAYGGSAAALTKATGGAWTGTGIITARTAFTLTMSGLPASYQAKAGDRLSYEWGLGRAYHEVVEDVAANSSGVITVTVEPYLREPYPSISTTVTLIRAPIVLKMVPDTWSAPDDLGPQRISFEAVQVI